MNELNFQLDSKLDMPLYEQIYLYIKTEIKEGRLCKNTKLPSARGLSTYLDVSRSTVDMAYAQLVSEGYISAVPCKGYFVSDIELLVDMEISNKDNTKNQKNKNVTSNNHIDFNIGGIALDAFPFSTWRKITRNVLSADNKELFNAGNSKGDLEFREVIRKYLYESRGVDADAKQIIVGAGNDYLLMILLKLLGNVTIAMENPCYMQAYLMFCSMNKNVETIMMDEYGISVEELSKSLANIAYVTPSHQFPTGVIMPIKRRIELLKWASEKKERYIIEDDYDSEFRYVGKPIPSLNSIDIDEKVIYIGTLSRSIAPAIRMSYIVLPKALLRKYDEVMSFYSSTVSRIDQTIVKEFIEEGYFERHLNKMRSIYKLKHDLLIKEIKGMKTKVSISGQNAGVHLILEVDNGMNEEELVNCARLEGVKIYKLSSFYINNENTNNDNTNNENINDKNTNNSTESNIHSSRVVLGFAGMTEDEIIKGIVALDKAWKGK